MYSDFFDQIDAARNGRRPRSANSESSIVPEVPPLVSFKAGKMKLIELPSSDSTSYRCEADTARGEVRIVYADRNVQWQWYDRKAKKVIDKYIVTDYETGTDGNNTFERIEMPSKKHKKDRIYVWTRKSAGGELKYDMYWMQDASEEKDDEIVAQVNQYLADPDSALPESVRAANAADAASGSATSAVGGAGTTSSAAASSSAAAANSSMQVDALSSILENLGMPQTAATSPSEGGSSGVAAPSGTGTKQLTLADLQGAMAGIQAAQIQQHSSSVGPPLNEIVTSEAVTAILESDEAVKQRLIQLLPPEQQSEEFLADNLRSPQVQQTLRTLTQALLPDRDTGDLSGYASVIANFNLDPSDGQDALTQTGNPIQAFLDCIIKSVEKEKNAATQAEGKGDDEAGKEEEEKQEE